MWRKRNLHALLVGMQIDTTTVEKSMEAPLKIKNRNPYNPIIPLLGIYSKKTKTLIQKAIGTSMFIAPLFTIAKIWKPSKCPLIFK